MTRASSTSNRSIGTGIRFGRQRTILCATIWAFLAACRGSAGDASAMQVRIDIDAEYAGAEVAVGDLAGGGHLELVTNGDGDVLVFGETADGRFELVSRTSAGENAGGMALADFDEDGALDVLVANHDTEYITLLLGDGSGRLVDRSRIRPGVTPHPHEPEAADIDGDGHLDALIDSRGDHAILVLRGDGDGGFRTPATRVDVGGDPYRGMALGDLNGDGWVDLVTPNPSEVAVILNREGRLERAGAVAASSPFNVALGDLNADGALDIISAAERGPAELRLGDGTGRFDASPTVSRDLPNGAKRIRVGDFDGDGVDDAAITIWFSDRLFLLMGSAGRAEWLSMEVEGAENPWGLATADLNGDGCDDLVVGDAGAARLFVFRSRRSGDGCGHEGARPLASGLR